MPFKSINPTHPRINLWTFGDHCSAFGGGWKTQFFWVGHFDFFFFQKEMRFRYWKYLYNHIESNSPYYCMVSNNQSHHSCIGKGWCRLDKNCRQKINCFGPLLSVLQYIDNPGNTLHLCMAHSNLLHQNCSFHCWSGHGKNRPRPMDLWFQH